VPRAAQPDLRQACASGPVLESVLALQNFDQIRSSPGSTHRSGFLALKSAAADQSWPLLANPPQPNPILCHLQRSD